mgnify:CR=1 FL=1|tara:strand:+ start:772 stop:1092 length:321 start_codon:yes stop_codon:yes gene_type:complete
MVVKGSLVKEDCSIESKSRMGTIVKVTDIVLHENSPWKQEVERWISYNSKNGQQPDMNMCHVIRPGKVVSVRWQSDPTNLTIHVFYNDGGSRSFYSYGSNGIEVIK